MANKDFERMIKLGEWIENYLDPNITIWGYQNLAKKAVKILNIDYVVNDDDLTFEAIKLVETLETVSSIDTELKETKPSGKNFYSSKPRLYSKLLFGDVQHKILDKEKKVIFEETTKKIWPQEKLETFSKGYYKCYRDIYDSDDLFEDIKNGQDPLKLYQTLSKNNIEKMNKVNPTFTELWGERFPVSILNVYLFRKYIEANFTIIDHYKKTPWEHTQEFIDDLDSDRRCFVWLYAAYNDLSDQLRLIDGSFKILKKFRGEDSFFAETITTVVEGAHTIFPWGIVSSRIFFDFLMLGGQNYFLFCEYCGRFAVIQRKGRKKFCSDICRTAHRNAELAKL